ncbi:hypothetical protein DdX_06595 [Ditylenchus destructor]|uniref:Uncharacterized protein n=1 Tax=Ditylenchus destructor TaxID=166010 RepID=A0AAD4N667_9BILA|nr:hypothetical protein DdX_06595 [Ditylenchus destructor]
MDKAKEKITDGYDTAKQKLTGKPLSHETKQKCPIFKDDQRPEHLSDIQGQFERGELQGSEFEIHQQRQGRPMNMDNTQHQP